MSPEIIPPIACTLAPGDMKERFAWIAALNRDALLSSQRCDLVLTLVYKPVAADRVRELMRREQVCCAFLTFHLDEELAEMRLTITAPEEAREAADMVFEQFIATDAQSGCGCASQAKPMTYSPAKLGGRRAANAAGVVALTLSTGAVACGACCVLPMVLPALALAGGGSLLAAMLGAKPLVMTLAIAAVAAAWIWVGWTSLRSKMWPAVSTLCLMVLATSVLGVAAIWPSIEGRLMQALAG
jgi:hypothetical protein